MSATKQSGFTLIELMIVIAIIGILAAIAVPQYQTYTMKAKFSEVVSAAGPYKTGIELCATDNGVVVTPFNSNVCDAGTSVGGTTNPTGEVPAAYPSGGAAATGYTATVTTSTGIITATGNTSVGSNTYILTPTISGGLVTWAKTGTCIASGLC